MLNKLEKKQGPPNAHISALYYFPEVFQSPIDEYLYSIIKRVIEGEPEAENVPKNINVYLSNIHIGPLSRYFKTNVTSPLFDKKLKKYKGLKDFSIIH